LRSTHDNPQPVLLIVTEGEPTSHLDPDGSVYFAHPPHPQKIELPIKEFDSSARQGAQTTLFRLGEDPSLARFIDGMARRAGDRVVAPELNDLGAAVVQSFSGDRTGTPIGDLTLGARDWFGSGRGY